MEDNRQFLSLEKIGILELLKEFKESVTNYSNNISKLLNLFENQENCKTLFDVFEIKNSDEVLFINKNYINTMKNDNTIPISSEVKDYLSYINPTTNILLLQNDGYLSYVNLT